MTRIVVLPADESACGYYRMRLPAGAVQQIRPEWDIEVYRPTDVLLGGGYNQELWEIKGIPDPTTIDLLVVQRVGSCLHHNFVRWAIEQGIAVVMDSDDAMWCIDKRNAAFKAWNSEHHHWKWLDATSRIADLTTVTTPKLAERYGKHGRTAVLPNCIPGELYQHLNSIRDDFDSTVTIGWAGFTSTHPNDLPVVGDAVRRVVEDTGALVRVIGDGAGAARDWGLASIHEMPPVPIGMAYYTALTTMDIGLVPLESSTFNGAKSYLKALEMAAVGVPVVASPTPANRELSRTVPIELVGNPREWYAAVTRLINNPEYRAERGQAAREAVFQHHTYETNAEAWAGVWERAVVRRERMMA